jgi:hypothetical protein
MSNDGDRTSDGNTHHGRLRPALNRHGRTIEERRRRRLSTRACSGPELRSHGRINHELTRCPVTVTSLVSLPPLGENHSVSVSPPRLDTLNNSEIALSR